MEEARTNVIRESSEFFTLMRNRLIMGSIRYGPLGHPDKPQFDRHRAISDRLKKWKATGNDELLVDIANLALVEYIEGNHKNKHFESQDGGGVKTK